MPRRVVAVVDGPGFHVDVSVLDEVAKGVRESVADQTATALNDVIEATACGHTRLDAAIANFCVRWNGGIDVLTVDASAIADGLGHAASLYRQVDAALAGALIGDPGVQAISGG
jgi:hypothetical protein